MVNPSNNFPDFERILATSGLTNVPGGEQMLARLLNTPAEVDNLVARYASGERDFRGIQLQGVQILRNINLSGADLRQANLQSTNLTAANLSGANLEGADLSHAELGQANLSGANLTGAQLRYARLIQTNLTNANLDGAALEGANFSGCIMPDGHRDPAHERSMAAIGQFQRSAWQPVIREGDGDLSCSKFGGKPWLNADETWPSCPNCGNSMRFFFQINLKTIPAELNEKFGQGILQLFYCTNEIRIVSDHPTNAMGWTEETAEGPKYIHYQSCEYECGGGEQFSACQFVRIVEADGVSQNVEIPATGKCLSMVGEGDFPPRLIIDWRRIDDYPSGDEVIAQGIQLSADDQDYLRDSGTYPQGDKLSGWPGWTQQIEYPDCPICHQEMAHLIFQLASDDHIPFLWGDMGEGYIFQCPEHRSEVAFLYQS